MITTTIKSQRSQTQMPSETWQIILIQKADDAETIGSHALLKTTQIQHKEQIGLEI